MITPLLIRPFIPSAFIHACINYRVGIASTYVDEMSMLRTPHPFIHSFLVHSFIHFYTYRIAQVSQVPTWTG